ncbi:hypothetical protein AX17_001092 [Amanita inopinata Kibby_2008]|nr:hypothetical protein AX17_001092 [Amanita inopinata Kibby_2008]
MPRLLPRLAHRQQTYPFDIRPLRRRTKSLVKPPPSQPSFNPANHSQSLLLAENTITHSRDYVHHKLLPPRLHIPKRAKARENECDRPREMNEVERRWWSNPYCVYAVPHLQSPFASVNKDSVRMLSSPIRHCTITNRYYPSDFLIRLGPVKLPSVGCAASERTALIPDGLQHAKFTARRVGRAVHVLCSRDALKLVGERGQILTRGQVQHPHLSEHVAHLLRLRILQELELLAERLEQPHALSNTKNGPSSVLRRLTRHEWTNIRETGIIPFKDAVAVLVVPPPNKDPITKQRPDASMSASPLPDDIRGQKPLPPASLLYPSQDSLGSLDAKEFPDLISHYQLPLYNGLALFPNKHQRAALHHLLLRIISAEKKRRELIRHTIAPVRDIVKTKGRARGFEKGSHAFLLSSDSSAIRCADAPATAIALWRLRMFEGGGMESDSAWTSPL